MALSKKALDALVAAKTGQSQTVATDPTTLNELKDAGLVGRGNGITRRGSIIQEREFTTRMEELF